MDDEQATLLSRRRLLAAGAVVVAGVAVPASSASAMGLLTGSKQAKPLLRYARTGYRRSRFAPHVGTPVKLRPRGAAAVRGMLLAIEDVPFITSLAGDQDVFTLRFRGPATPALPEGIAGIRHKHFGVVELYLTALPSDGVSQDYLAVINRRVPRGVRRAMRHAGV